MQNLPLKLDKAMAVITENIFLYGKNNLTEIGKLILIPIFEIENEG